MRRKMYASFLFAGDLHSESQLRTRPKGTNLCCLDQMSSLWNFFYELLERLTGVQENVAVPVPVCTVPWVAGTTHTSVETRTKFDQKSSGIPQRSSICGGRKPTGTCGIRLDKAHLLRSGNHNRGSQYSHHPHSDSEAQVKPS